MGKKQKNKDHDGKMYIAACKEHTYTNIEVLSIDTFTEALKAMQVHAEEMSDEGSDPYSYSMYEIAREVKVEVETSPRVIADGCRTKS